MRVWRMYMMVENQITMGFRVGGFEFETVEHQPFPHLNYYSVWGGHQVIQVAAFPAS